MARNTSMSYLMKKTDAETTTYAKLIDVKDIPALGQAPNMLDATTLSNTSHVYIPDIKDTGGGLEFTANYSKADYETLLALEGQEVDYAIWLGASESGGVLTPDGSEGKWEFKGILSVWLDAASVGAVHDMKFSIAPTTEIKHVTA